MKTMKVIGVISSANENGNSAALLREALNGAKEAQAQVTEIFLPGYRIGFCQGCLRCLREGECFQKDDFAALQQAFRESDGIILSTPTYAGAPCARLKNLIDRLGLFEYMTSSVFGGKYVVAIATAKSSGAKQAASYLSQVASGGVFAQAHISGRLGVVLRGGKSAAEFPGPMSKARQLGMKMVANFQSQRTFKSKFFFARLFKNLVMRPLIAKGIAEHSETDMRGVYTNLKKRAMIN